MSTILFLVAITMIWYLPGLILRSWKEDKMDIKLKKKVKDQEKAIARLYPKEK
tara:strand:- start:321 stop:479 length:159 start_codon:yes stop_codon:yes gene_type:complete